MLKIGELILPEEKYQQRAEIMKALAHPTRLFMVEFLADGEKCVCEFLKKLDFDQSTVSKHLAVLKNAGIVDAEKRGLNMYYSLKCPCILNIFSCIESLNTPEK